MPTLGLSMIVKNGAETLPLCLKSVEGIVDQIVVVDTGSSDNSIEVARQLGAEIYQIPWTDHFANARNAALSHITTDWVLSLDDDEELDEQSRRELPALLANPAINAYWTIVRNYDYCIGAVCGFSGKELENDNRHPRAAKAKIYVNTELCRLFRRDPRIYFTGRVHEIVEPQVIALGAPPAPCGIIIHHFGRLCDREERSLKSDFYFRLAEIKVQDSPEDGNAWYTLGSENMSRRKYTDAIACYEKALKFKLIPKYVTIPLAEAYFNIGAMEKTIEVLGTYPSDPEYMAQRTILSGMACYNLGQYENARKLLQAVSEVSTFRRIEVLCSLGLSELQLGMQEEGLGHLRTALAEQPDDPLCHDNLYKGLLLAGKVEEAATVATTLANTFLNPRNSLRASALWGHIQQWQKAIEILEKGLQYFPGDTMLTNALETVRQQQEPKQVNAKYSIRDIYWKVAVPATQKENSENT